MLPWVRMQCEKKVLANWLSPLHSIFGSVPGGCSDQNGTHLNKILNFMGLLQALVLQTTFSIWREALALVQGRRKPYTSFGIAKDPVTYTPDRHPHVGILLNRDFNLAASTSALSHLCGWLPGSVNNFQR